MLMDVIVVGLVTLAVLAVLVGSVDECSQRGAWRKIAKERRALAECEIRLEDRARALAEEARELWDWEGQLIAAAECGGCPACELRRRRRDGPGGRSGET
jgi:hypothetical protein